MRYTFYSGIAAAFVIGFTVPLFFVGRGNWIMMLSIAVQALILLKSIIDVESGDVV